MLGFIGVIELIGILLIIFILGMLVDGLKFAVNITLIFAGFITMIILLWHRFI